MKKLFSRTAMMLLLCMLNAATAWAKSEPTIDLSTVHADFTAHDGDALIPGSFMTITKML